MPALDVNDGLVVEKAFGFEVLFEEAEIHAIGLDDEVESIAGHGDCAPEEIEAEIADHAEDQFLGGSKSDCLADDVEAEPGTDEITDAGDQSDQSVEPDSKLSPGNADGVVEESSEGTDFFDPFLLFWREAFHFTERGARSGSIYT